MRGWQKSNHRIRKLIYYGLSQPDEKKSSFICSFLCHFLFFPQKKWDLFPWQNDISYPIVIFFLLLFSGYCTIRILIHKPMRFFLCPYTIWRTQWSCIIPCFFSHFLFMLNCLEFYVNGLHSSSCCNSYKSHAWIV